MEINRIKIFKRGRCFSKSHHGKSGPGNYAYRQHSGHPLAKVPLRPMERQVCLKVVLNCKYVLGNPDLFIIAGCIRRRRFDFQAFIRKAWNKLS
jgi:hypothetical protein